MGMQKIIILLKALADNAITRSKRGIVCLILDDPNVTGLHKYTRLRDVKDNYSAANKALITRCFSDRGAKYLKIVCYDSAAATPETIDNALTLLNDVKFNYLACPSADDTAKKQKITQFIKDQRKNNNILVKAVLNNHEADYEGIINFINNQIHMSDGTTYTGLEFTVDVACICANVALNSSITNAAVDGVRSVDIVGDNLDTLVDEGKIFLFYDFDLESVVFSRGVNSKITVNTGEKESLKKIRIIEILDMVRDDFKVNFKANYQGKIDNSLTNKRLLVSNFNAYLRALVKQGALNDGQASEVYIDIESQKNYLEDEKKIDTSALKDVDILAYNTDEHVFLAGVLYIDDAMEDLNLVLSY